jgi:glycosyltransferase involved in cell wall biosynthesis
VFNGEAVLKNTILSVFRQKSSRVEYVIVDGASTDNTLEVIKQNSMQIDQWISEPDNGIFDAMNKGINLAKGQWLIFINAGDQLVPGAIKYLDIDRKSNFGIVYGNTIRGQFERTFPYREEWITTGNLPMCHQSTLYNRAVLKDEMYYKSDYRLFSENELFMRIFSLDIPTCYADVDIAYFLGGGVSSTTSAETRKAKYKFLYHYFGFRGLALAVLLRMGLLNKNRYQLRRSEVIENDGLVLV